MGAGKSTLAEQAARADRVRRPRPRRVARACARRHRRVLPRPRRVGLPRARGGGDAVGAARGAAERARPRRRRRHLSRCPRGPQGPRDHAVGRRRRGHVLGASPELRSAARAGRGGVPPALRGAPRAVRVRRRRGRPRRERRRPRGRGNSRRARRPEPARRARPRRRRRGTRLRSERGRHPRRGRAAGARLPAGAGARAAAGRGGEDADGARPAVAGPPPRPARDDRRSRRRVHDRRGRVRGCRVPSRRRVGAGADEPRRAGRRRHRRQDGDRSPAGEEPRRRIPLARAPR